ncbi:PepSY domain-containing protein [Fulvimarina endophytica]|uniref:PepSY domain-containing protein n=1 Tax=Fulvimarina endophytica TaxID=2293836 RepID=A0A371X2I3_9HYPH|nr:PepSY-associated TM helix domain-containing protein [Fulvimarina endophytica]RFC63423.1 PepSY domain-containing protein [Fulvimarina endophytica]
MSKALSASAREPSRKAAASVSTTGLMGFVARLHFYIGLFVGPFLFVAALTGTLYALTPQIERLIYSDQLTTPSTGTAQPLSAQAEAARRVVGEDLRLFAVRPAPEPGTTTRVMFADPALGPSETRAIFVDPVTLDVRGDLTAYGTSGILPFRITLDYLHRSLMLGDWGRAYSELAASWLWLLALGGIVLWARRRTGRAAHANPANTSLRVRRLHGITGVVLSVGLLFLSATGLTWSQWAGDRIGELRGALGWTTPSVTLALEGSQGRGMVGDHAHHGAMGMTMPAGASEPAVDPAGRLDGVLSAAQAGGIDASLVEIRPSDPGEAYVVREIDRSWPSQVDTVAVDPATMAITSRADFADFGLVAKLVQWGVAAHMGILFGLANQIAVVALGIGTMALTVYGYRIWWRQRPAPGNASRTLTDAWMRMRPATRIAVLAVAAALGWALPVLGASLLAFLAIDLLRWGLARRGLGRPQSAAG